MKSFQELREAYPTFIYHGYKYHVEEDYLLIVFDFEIVGLSSFHPELKIGLEKNANYDQDVLNSLVFHIGMVESISYWKATCSPTFKVKAGYLDSFQISWFQKLFFDGLGEFRYVNQILVPKEEFLEIVVDSPKVDIKKASYDGKGNLIAVGGGKDSIVSLEILKDLSHENTCFILNPKSVTLKCCEVAGYGDFQIAKVYRKMDSKLFELNKLGFLNGHTPLSSLLAFISYLEAYLYHKKYIVLSNENSANQETVLGSGINHQYSKSYEFEKLFFAYVNKYLPVSIYYFSLLRPLNEYQIAFLFSKYKKYHSVFKSCNLGSKNDDWTWCGNCPKCLFIFSILSPFLNKRELVSIFSKDLFEREDLLSTFLELLGKGKHKPFECVGTIEEMNYAVISTISNLEENHLPLPFLLRYYKENYFSLEVKNPLLEYNLEHQVPLLFEKLLKEALYQ